LSLESARCSAGMEAMLFFRDQRKAAGLARGHCHSRAGPATGSNQWQIWPPSPLSTRPVEPGHASGFQRQNQQNWICLAAESIGKIDSLNSADFQESASQHT
jgi:hypothetical protein